MLKRVFMQSGFLIWEIKSKCRGYFQKELLWRDTKKGRWSQENEKEKDAWEIFTLDAWFGLRETENGKMKREVVFLCTRSWRWVAGSSTGALLLLLKFLRGLITLACSGLKRLMPLWEWRKVSKEWTFKAGFISIFLPNFMGHYHRQSRINCTNFLLQRSLISFSLFLYFWHIVVMCFYCLTIHLGYSGFM